MLATFIVVAHAIVPALVAEPTEARRQLAAS
jgi:hypothetical protein